MSSPQLPNEILLAIINCLLPSDHATLRACQLTSRTVNEFSTRVLYQDLHISWLANRGFALLFTLSQNLSLASLVVSVTADFPRFEDIAQVQWRFDEETARLWEEEERTWPERLDPDCPEDDEYWEGEWTQELEDHLGSRDSEMWGEAEDEAWAEFATNGSDRWLDHPAQDDDGSRDHIGRREGGALLAVLLASLPNLLRVDIAGYDGGIPSLPYLTHLALENPSGSRARPVVPKTPNVKKLVLKGHFFLGPKKPRLDSLHTLHIHSRLVSTILPRLVEASRLTLQSLEVSFADGTAWGSEGEFVRSLGTLLVTAQDLDSLLILGNFKIPPAEDVSPFMSYLAQSALRDVSLPFLPSHHLFASLPPTIERVQLLEAASELVIVNALDILLLEKERLPHLVFVELREEPSADARNAMAEDQVLQGKVLGVEIVLC